MRHISGVVLVLVSCAAFAAAGEPEEPVWEFAAEGGNGRVEVAKFLDAVAAETGARFAFDPTTPAVRNRSVFLRGTARIPKSKVFAWAEALLFHHGLILVPGSSGAGYFWNVIPNSDPAVSSAPLFIPWTAIDRYADREGLLVTTVVPFRYLRESSRARNSLTQMSTRIVGRIADVPAFGPVPATRGRQGTDHIAGPRAMVILDFAPMAAAMVKLLGEVETAAARDELLKARVRLAGASDVRARAPIEKEIAAIEAYLAGTGPDRSTPEGTLAAWRRASRDGDADAQFDILAPESLRKMGEQFRQMKAFPQFTEYAAKFGITPELLEKISHREFTRIAQAYATGSWFVRRRANDFRVVRIGPVAEGRCRVEIRVDGRDQEIVLVRLGARWFLQTD